MRLWSLHPEYLDRMGLLGLWREALLAQKVLHGLTNNYKHHSHMQRFYALPVLDAFQHISDYLFYIWQEGRARGYNFNLELIRKGHRQAPVMLTTPAEFTVTSGQLALEFQILKYKLKSRHPKHLELLQKKFGENRMWTPKPNPVFTVIHGEREPWEKFVLQN